MCLLVCAWMKALTERWEELVYLNEIRIFQVIGYPLNIL